ncbi:MAG TPA: hypothetical protein VNL71_23970 [Chloroflexota bacterium]|nr:hypothetical protein [Chloroflexota bacterium]
MPTTETGDTKHPTTPPWARRLAARQRLAPPGAPQDSRVSAEEAINALWALFDTTYREANAALEAIGEPGRISVIRAPNQRSYQAIGPDGSPRVITIVALLSVVDGRLRGGAFVGINRSRLSIYIAPSGERGRACWRVATSSQSFTRALVRDLFLSVFGDDPAATLRLSPLSGHDSFQDVWS